MLTKLLGWIRAVFDESGRNAEAWVKADRAAANRLDLNRRLPDEVDARKGPAHLTGGGNLSSRFYPARKPLTKREQRELQELEAGDG